MSLQLNLNNTEGLYNALNALVDSIGEDNVNTILNPINSIQDFPWADLLNSKCSVRFLTIRGIRTFLTMCDEHGMSFKDMVGKCGTFDDTVTALEDEGIL